MVKADLIRESGGKYTTTYLGQTASKLYFDPFSVVGLYKNMLNVSKKDIHDIKDSDYAYILSNIHQYARQWVTKADQEAFDKDIYLADRYTLIHQNIKKPFYVYYKMLQGDPNETFGAYQYQLSQDTERVCMALKMLDSYYKLGFGPELDVLSVRLKYKVQRHLSSLVLVPHIGKVRAEKLWNNGVRTYEDLIAASSSQLRDIGIMSPEIMGEIQEGAKYLLRTSS